MCHAFRVNSQAEGMLLLSIEQGKIALSCARALFTMLASFLKPNASVQLNVAK